MAEKAVYNPLIAAAIKGHEPIVRLLVKDGANLNIVRKIGRIDKFLSGFLKCLPPTASSAL